MSTKGAIPLKILDVLSKDCVFLDIQATLKNDVIAELVDKVFLNKPPALKAEILQALLEREKLGSTGIGSGVAVPHTKSAQIERIICGLGVSFKGLDFEALDAAPVHLIFLLVAPLNSQSEHLNILARIVRLLKDRVFRQALREAKTADDVVHLISEEDS